MDRREFLTTSAAVIAGLPGGVERARSEVRLQNPSASGPQQLRRPRKGSIEVGKFGDFVVLSADPRGHSLQEVHAIATHATIVGGTVVYEAAT